MSRKRQGPARWTLPQVIDPPDSVCFQIQVPNDKFHVAAFLGAIYDLAKPYKWANDDDHTALAVGAVWFKIFEKLRRGNCNVPTHGGVEIDDMARIRTDPDDPCILQIECLPDQWETLMDVSACFATLTGQPGPGGDTPPPGTNRDDCYKLSGNGQLLLPYPVTDGQVLSIHSATGGWTDGGGSWYCPNGQSFTFGFCSGVGGFTGGDPLPTALHMSIIVKINGIYYDLASPITIPAGTGTVDAVFQANDASLTDNFGEISFCVKVEAPAAAPIAITYLVGSGPASCRVGDLVSIEFVNEGPDNGASYQFSECVQVSVVAFSGWHGPSGSDWTYFDCASASHAGPGSVADPTTFPAHTCVTKMNWGTGPGATTNITVKIEALC